MIVSELRALFALVFIGLAAICNRLDLQLVRWGLIVAALYQMGAAVFEYVRQRRKERP